MATAPWYVISPNVLLSAIGLLRGPDRTVATPAEDWHDAVVDVVIPAYRETENLPHCLTSIARQTLKPRNIIVVDDGSDDGTAALAEDTAAKLGLTITVIRRKSSIGKTPTIKRQAREFDADVEFILDGDTFLQSTRYIERCVQELYQGIGIASACGTILPMRLSDRRELAETPEFAPMHGAGQWHDPMEKRGRLHLIWWGITNMYRDSLYRFLQRFVYHGQMVFFGSITNPVGCAVAYRRKYIKDLFDHYEPLLGDDLTTSEDIFIGFALNNEGYRNIQLMDVTARSEEPEVRRLPRQIFLWSSSFLQSCFYFDDLMRSPFRAFRRLRKRMHERKASERKRLDELRTIKEPYRQAFGAKVTKHYGRPIGWVMFMGAAEKIGYPTSLIIMLIMHWWEAFWVTVVAEIVLSLIIITVVSPGNRLKNLGKALLITPLRYALIAADLFTLGRFASDLWFTGNRRWRK